METETKSYLRASLASIRDQQQELLELSVSLDAVIAALKTLNPKFEDAYDTELLNPVHAALRQSTQHVLDRVDGAIRQLNDKDEA